MKPIAIHKLNRVLEDLYCIYNGPREVEGELRRVDGRNRAPITLTL